MSWNPITFKKMKKGGFEMNLRSRKSFLTCKLDGRKIRMKIYDNKAGQEAEITLGLYTSMRLRKHLDDCERFLFIANNALKRSRNKKKRSLFYGLAKKV